MTNRQEVAEKLRESGKWLDEKDASSMRESLYLINQAMVTPRGREFSLLLNRLVDLIDPTCHDFGGEEGTNGENYGFACSSCGWCGDVTSPNYCPNCGARVVRE